MLPRRIGPLLLTAVLLILTTLLSSHGVQAFTTKKREGAPAHATTSSSKTVRPAFSMNKSAEANHMPLSSSSGTAAVPRSSSQQYMAFTHQLSTLLTDDEFALDDDEILIGYGTAIISCVLSLALGFGLGYGT